MNKKILIIVDLIILILLILSIIYFYNYNSIKKGDIFTNVNFKNELSYIKSKTETSIGIYDSNSKTSYFIDYNGELLKNPYILITITDKNQKKELYLYNWEDIQGDPERKIVCLPKGWSKHDTTNEYDNTFSPISDNPIININGTVVYTKGNTSLIKKCLQGL